MNQLARPSRRHVLSPPAARRAVRVAAHVAAFAGVLVAAPRLAAQIGGQQQRPPVVIQGGTVHVGNGDVIRDATIVIRGRSIEAVGAGVAVPEGATVIDAAGKHVYPGLIDVESFLLLDAASRAMGEGNPTARVVDGLDLHDPHAFELAWSGGVTTLGVVSRRGLFDGPRAVVKLKRGGRSNPVVREEGDLAFTFGRNAGRPSMRLRDWKTLAEQLQQTQKYIESWDEYAEKLEEYKKELEKWGKDGSKLPEGAKGAEGGAKPEAPGGEARPEGRRGPPGGEGRRPRPPRQHHHDTPFLNWLRDTLGWMCDCGLPGHEGDDGHDHERLVLSDGVSFAEDPAPQGGEGKPEEKKGEAPKKPGRPAKDAIKEALRRALEGKVGVNVYCGDAADVENLLELLGRHALSVVVTGGPETAQLADALADRGLKVVLVQPHDLGSDGLDAAARLDEAGVDVVLTTAGSTAEATRHLTLSAAAAIAGGLEPEAALAAITSRAAAVLGVADKLGTLEAGKDADLVIASGELFASTTRIERVLVEGSPVLER